MKIPLLTLLASLSLVSASHAAIIDFETIPGGTPSDGLSISTQFQASQGVTFSLEGGGSPVLAQVGAPQTAFRGFNNLADQPAPGTNVGQFFLTDDGTLSGLPQALLVDYSTSVSAASGVILDIDFAEQWTIEALSGMSVIGSQVLGPFGSGAGTNGATTVWSFDFGTNTFDRLRFSFTGTATSGAVGLAFDNFSPSSPIPLPAAVWLFGSGLLGLIGIARSKKVA